MTGRTLTGALVAALAGLAIGQPDAGQPDAEPPADPGALLEELRDQIGVPAEAGIEAALSPAVRTLLSAPFLDNDERRELRIRHGVWQQGDLERPEDRARAALALGAYDDAAFADPAVPAVVRAEALVARGEPGRALEALAGEGSLRAIRVRTQALFDLGRFDDAEAAAQTAVDRLLRARVEDPEERAEGVRTLLIRSRLRGDEGLDGADFEAMVRILAGAREEAPLSWRVRLAEAELVYDKHNLGEAVEAATEALSLNPRSAWAVRTIGRVSIDSFNIDQAESAAAQLDEWAGLLHEDDDAVSIAGAAIRARALLRQRSPDEAARALDAALERAPMQRELIALRAAAAATTFEDAEAERWLAEVEDLSPGTPLGLYEVGSALAEARQYEVAAGYLARAAERLPTWASPWTELGLLQVQAGNDAAAQAALTTATRLDPFDRRAANSLNLVTELRSYEMLESEHFAIRYRAGIDELLAREMLPVMEEIHDRVAAQPEQIPGGLGFEPDRRTIIELMPDHRWFSVRITGMTRVHTIAAATGPVIAFESPQVGPGFTSGPFDWPRVLQHEYGHTVALARTRNRVPHWFTEAASVELEDAPRAMGTWRLLAGAFEGGTLFDLNQINIAFVRPEKPTDRAQAYAQGHWMYRFIMEEWGPRTPLNLMDRYAAGEDEASAFEAELGVDRDEFMARFTAWAEDSLRTVGMVPAVDAPTVPEMIGADQRELDDGERVRPDRAFANRWLEQFPDHPDLLELAARLALEDEPAGAAGTLSDDQVGALMTYAAARPVDDWPHRLLARHALSLEGDERFAAIEHLEFLDDREQSSIAFAATLARLHAERGQHDAAEAKAERATRIAPFDADTRELAARVALVAGDVERAKRHIEALAFLEPDREIHQRRLEAVDRLARGG